MPRVVDALPPPHERLLAWVDRWRWPLVGAMLILYAAAFNGQWRIGPDSAVHVAIARSIADGQGFVHPTDRQFEVNPGLAYGLALLFRLVPDDQQMLVSHLVATLLGLTAVALVYKLFRLHADRPTAVLVALLVGIAETHFRYGFFLLTDMPFAIGGLIVLIGLELLSAGTRGSRIVLALGLTAAGMLIMALFRSVFVTFVGAMVAALLVRAVKAHDAKRWATLAGVVLIGVIAWLAWTRFGGPSQDERAIAHAFQTNWLQTFTTTLASNTYKLVGEVAPEAVLGPDFGMIAGIRLGVPLGLIILGAGLALSRQRVIWGVLVTAFIVQWCLFIVTERYVLPILPLLVYGWWRSAATLSRWPARRRLQWLVLGGMVGLIVIGNLVKTSRFVLEQRATPFYESYMRGRYAPLLATARWLADHTPPDAIVLMDERLTAELTALSNRPAISRHRLQADLAGNAPIFLLEPIEDRTLQRLRRQGWTIGPVVFTTPAVDGSTWQLCTLDRP